MKTDVLVTADSRVYNGESGLEICTEACPNSIKGLDKGCAVFSSSQGWTLPESIDLEEDNSQETIDLIRSVPRKMPRARSATSTHASKTDDSKEMDMVSLSAQMPLLARLPLHSPNFHRTDWVPGQVFSNSQDDPDRTCQPWTPPTFLFDEDPIARRKVVSVQELDVPNRSSFRFARVLRGVLNHVECAALLAKANEKGFTPVLLNIGNDQQQLAPGLRDGHRVIVDSSELTSWLMEVIRPYLPAELENGAKLNDLNERCRILLYTPGQEFTGHYDGRYRRPHDHPHAGDFSRVTVQFYLHDVPQSHGGATTFFPDGPRPIKHQPETGSVLLFTQDLYHEGSLVKEGIKYTIRTEAMYRPFHAERDNKYKANTGGVLIPSAALTQ